eukprot:TRINITY_DN2116_c0_g1_i1.p1 TRINITY_DN2116_c0_g1~~TRINITY_DN2116_c0_g1_i1.p1  ORF type:complete len:319 (+),score=26.80 TRINITY_DN2116_c0_g1_i1:52-1008(+)
MWPRRTNGSPVIHRSASPGDTAKRSKSIPRASAFRPPPFLCEDERSARHAVALFAGDTHAVVARVPRHHRPFTPSGSVTPCSHAAATFPSFPLRPSPVLSGTDENSSKMRHLRVPVSSSASCDGSIVPWIESEVAVPTPWWTSEEPAPDSTRAFVSSRASSTSSPFFDCYPELPSNYSSLRDTPEQSQDAEPDRQQSLARALVQIRKRCEAVTPPPDEAVRAFVVSPAALSCAHVNKPLEGSSMQDVLYDPTGGFASILLCPVKDSTSDCMRERARAAAEAIAQIEQAQADLQEAKEDLLRTQALLSHGITTAPAARN